MIQANPLVATSDYIPGKEALLITVDLSQYLIDYYIHLKTTGQSVDQDQDEKLKQLIACFAIYLMDHPAGETHAWTLHIGGDEPFSLFVTGSTDDGFIVGHALTENIKQTEQNVFHSQVAPAQGELRKSFVHCDSSDIRQMVEYFYEQSEQRPIRISLPTNSDISTALVALPDCDYGWFHSVDITSLSSGAVSQGDTAPNDNAAADGSVGREPLTLKPLRKSEFSFLCNCSPEKLLPFFRSVDSKVLDELYGADQEITMACPRCGRHFAIPRGDVMGH